MGLPLFVAPVESDCPLKAASKSGATSPGRSDIRRQNRPESRERRNAVRTAGAGIFGPVEPRAPRLPRLPRSSQDSFLPWVESPAPLDQNPAEQRPRPSFQESRHSGDVSWPLNDGHRRERFQRQIAAIFGTDLRQQGPTTTSQREAQPRDAEERLRPTEPRSARARRARVVAPLSSRFDRSPDRPRSYRRSPSRNERLLRTNGVPLLGQANHAPGPRHFFRLLRSARNQRSPADRQALVGLDGLGDRERSLSPEVWDTLLSTLTPDPQPPSAGSSFVSAAASQSAVPSSSTPTSAPDVLERTAAAAAAADAQCDSGCEHSDMDMDEDEENVDLAGMRLYVPQPRVEQRQRVTSRYDVEGAADGSRADGRQPTTQPLAHDDMSLGSARGDVTVGSAGLAPRGVPLARLLNQAEGWARHLSTEEASSEEERGVGGVWRQNRREGSTEPGQNAALGDEDWPGMQRIVRSLARREDIPDEWWAEAGLSRTLPQDDAAHE